MAKGASRLFDVECPCCRATLKVDPETEAVISHTVPEKPHIVEDMATALSRLKGEDARREEAFQKSFQAEKKSKDVLSKKFDELLKQAKEKPDLTRPTRDIDLD
jgi:predicted nucleotide-binding protein (sugar kinase/HSP70/actin superfamily)